MLASIPLLLALQCTTTTPNSHTAGAWLHAPINGPAYTVTGLPPNTIGGLFVSIPNANTFPGTPFQQGTLCIASPYKVIDVGSTGQGTITNPISWQGQTYQYIQYWYRDYGTTISTNTWKWTRT
jgi:hypothetical protein